MSWSLTKMFTGLLKVQFPSDYDNSPAIPCKRTECLMLQSRLLAPEGFFSGLHRKNWSYFGLNKMWHAVWSNHSRATIVICNSAEKNKGICHFCSKVLPSDVMLLHFSFFSCKILCGCAAMACGRARTKTSIHKGALSHLIATHCCYKGRAVHSVQSLFACLCW